MATTVGIQITMPEDRDAWEVRVIRSDGKREGFVEALTPDGTWEECAVSSGTPTVVLDARTVITGPPWLRPLLEEIVSHDRPLNLMLTREKN